MMWISCFLSFCYIFIACKKGTSADDSSLDKQPKRTSLIDRTLCAEWSMKKLETVRRSIQYGQRRFCRQLNCKAPRSTWFLQPTITGTPFSNLGVCGSFCEALGFCCWSSSFRQLWIFTNPWKTIVLSLESRWDCSAAEITALIAYVLLVHLASNSGPPLNNLPHVFGERKPYRGAKSSERGLYVV